MTHDSAHPAPTTHHHAAHGDGGCVCTALLATGRCVLVVVGVAAAAAVLGDGLPDAWQRWVLVGVTAGAELVALSTLLEHCRMLVLRSWATARHWHGGRSQAGDVDQPVTP